MGLARGLGLLFALALAGALASPDNRGFQVPADYQAAAIDLDAATRDWLQHNGVARRDGFVYGMDVAPLMLYAAWRNDAALYAQLLESAQPLIVTGGDAATDHFVLWRARRDRAPEVSGATEALWLARALWTGGRVIGRDGDRAEAQKILAGYARHADRRPGDWFVRKYYAFGTHSFAGLSILAAYYPDFVAEALPGAAKPGGIAQRSYALLRQAVTPMKLLAPLVQPDLEPDFPRLGVTHFAPNNLLPLADACDGAEGALRGAPELARGVLAFVGAPPDRRDTNGRLYAYFHRKTGLGIGDGTLATTGYACLMRLASALDDAEHQREFAPILAADMQLLAHSPQADGAPLYAAGPLLLTAYTVGAFGSGE